MKDVGSLGHPTGAPKDQNWPKLTKILNFFGFCHHLFYSGKIVLLLLQGSNAERLVENERQE